MKDLKELTREELIILDGGVVQGEDGRGCTEHGLATIGFGGPRKYSPLQ